MPVIAGYGSKDFLLNNAHLLGENGLGLEQQRLRRFTFGLRGREEVPSLLRWIDLAVLLLPDVQPSVVSDYAAVPVMIGGSGKAKRMYRQPAVTSTDGNETPSEKRRVARTCIGGGTLTPGAQLKREGQRTRGPENSRRYRLADACRLQGLPEDFLADAPFTAEGKLKAIANGVPLPMGRAIARAVKEALGTWT